MYEDRTQNYETEIHEEYLTQSTHDTPIPRHIICSRVQLDYSIPVAINTTNSTERQQFSVVTVRLKSGFSKFF